MNNLVIVESPAKAGTIEKILGKDFKVVSSYGHIRDLEKKNMGIDIDNSFTPKYQVTQDKKSVLKALLKEAKNSDVIWLATDEDREGEAIAWHLYEAMNLHSKKVNRIVFNEITKTAIQSAIKQPRNIDTNLVNAQQARRVLDRIVGFKLSPVLWKKVKSGLSAGRVQSVSVRLIVEKEKSIINFKPSVSYNIMGEFLTNKSELLSAQLLKNIQLQTDARELLESFIGADFHIGSIEKKPSKSSPSAPFTTSSLQQVASNKLGFSVSRTMTVAQKLYEAGHITYMRTDSTNLSTESVSSIKKYVLESYGDKYWSPRKYTTKTKVAQEAHEAIRPTNFFNKVCGKDDAQKKLYQLIWERTICSQMSDAIFNKTIININVSNPQKSIFQAKGQVIKFDGYLILQKQISSKKDVVLPDLKTMDNLKPKTIIAKEKYSKAPTRFTEASLVKKLEDLGIGRPSTYAPTISTIQKREYVLKDDVQGVEKAHTYLYLENNVVVEKTIKEVLGSEKKKLIPTEIGKITNDFLVSNFTDILDYHFTAKIEDEFDNIAAGEKEWIDVIQKFYNHFEPKVAEVDKNSSKVTALRELGIDPVTKKPVYVRLGKYGPIVQLGDIVEGEEKPKYAKLLKGQTIDSIDLNDALQLFSLPRSIGTFKDYEVVVSEGRYGPYIRYNNKFISLGGHNPMNVTLTTCVELIQAKEDFDKKRIINTFEYKENLIEVLNGRYGPYIKYGSKNYKIAKGLKPEELTKDDCLNLIEKSTKK